MAREIAKIWASLGKRVDDQGHERRVTREVGKLMIHSDGRAYLMMRADFDYGRIPVEPGRDAFFLEVALPSGQMGLFRELA